MDCLNNLEKEVVFIPTAALIALVLLVWVQLHVQGGRGERNVNWVCGVAWAYMAILSALTAVALFVLGHTSDCAKGFLILACFMTGIDIASLLFLNFAQLTIGNFSDEKSYKESCEKSLLGKCGRKKWWILFWVFLLFGLVLSSFLLAYGCHCWWVGLVWSGILVVGAVIVYFIVAVQEHRRRRRENERRRRAQQRRRAQRH